MLLSSLSFMLMTASLASSRRILPSRIAGELPKLLKWLEFISVAATSLFYLFLLKMPSSES